MTERKLKDQPTTVLTANEKVSEELRDERDPANTTERRVYAEDVEKAIHKLRAQGIPVNVRSLRDELGHGSNGTIIRHLHAFMEREAGEVINQGLPPIGQEQFRPLVQRIIELACEANLESCSIRLAENQAYFKRYSNGIEAQIDKLRQENKQLVEENQDLKRQLAQKEQAHQKARTDYMEALDRQLMQQGALNALSAKFDNILVELDKKKK